MVHPPREETSRIHRYTLVSSTFCYATLCQEYYSKETTAAPSKLSQAAAISGQKLPLASTLHLREIFDLAILGLTEGQTGERKKERREEEKNSHIREVWPMDGDVGRVGN
jgi:hypothetical protein